MGLFGLFERKAGGALRKHAERVANKRAQPPDRWDSIQFLVREGTEEAVDALLGRFAFYVDPSITDQEEKDAAFDGILRIGERAKPSVKRALARSESISWPLKLLDRLQSGTEVVEDLLAALAPMDVEYERDPQRKIQLVAALEERKDARIAPAVARFLKDANETVRFQSVAAILAQDNAAECRQDLLDCLAVEESVRIRNRVLDGFVQRDWDVADRRADVQTRLTAGYRIDPRGHVQRV